jgi:alpha-1,2-mannosyltransferase
VSGTSVTSSVAGARDPGASLYQRMRLTPTAIVALGAVVLALVLRLYLLSRPGYLLGVTEYDDGPYFGSAVRLLNGSLPYRDFVIVQPPGITLLMVPAALIAKVTGTAVGIAIGRVLTALAGAAAVALAWLLVRHRGVLATLVACGVLAIYPASVAAAHTVLVEPWLVLFCLTGAVAVFDGDRLTASRRRLAWGGAAFGFAGAVELWAIVPVLVVTGLCLVTAAAGATAASTAAAAAGVAPRIRRAAVFVGGTAAGFLVPTLPFAAAAPHGFYLSLITAQVGPRAHATRVPVWSRLYTLLGFTGLHLKGHDPLLIVGLIVIALAVGLPALAWLVKHSAPTALDWFALVSLILVTAMLMWPAQFHYHFAAFLAPFLGLAIGLPAARLMNALLATAAFRGEDWLKWLVPGAIAVIILGFTALDARAEVHPGHTYPQMTPSATRLVQRMQQVIPPGACVLADQVSYLLVANRFTSDVPGCSQMIDSVGTDLAYSGGLRPTTGAGRVPALAALWRTAFGHAQYVFLSDENKLRVAWNPSLRAYFTGHFALAAADSRGDALYKRKAG